jgi:oligopeptide transport system ATP-binding protein
MTVTEKNQTKAPLLEVKNLKTYFPVKKGILGREVARVHAVDDVSFSLTEGETLGLVGESGCGKSTLGRSLIQLDRPTSGEVFFEGQKINDLDFKSLKKVRAKLQMIFQDPFSSLDPRMSVERIVSEPLRLHRIGDAKSRLSTVKDLLKKVGLPESALTRYPHEFSGGQRQRIGIARSLALRPKLIIADEPVAALDVSVQAQVLNLMGDLKKEFGLTMVFISHDLGVIKYFCDKIAVMYLGKIVEYATSEDLYKNQIHPYTKALFSAIPVPDPTAKMDRVILKGDVPSPIQLPSGCRFHTRCPFVTDICKSTPPELTQVKPGHFAACHHKDSFMNQKGNSI